MFPARARTAEGGERERLWKLVNQQWTDSVSYLFFFNDTATTEIYTLSLHDALPISGRLGRGVAFVVLRRNDRDRTRERSEEHTSELQSPDHIVCRLLLEKKKKT